MNQFSVGDYVVERTGCVGRVLNPKLRLQSQHEEVMNVELADSTTAVFTPSKTRFATFLEVARWHHDRGEFQLKE